MRIVAVEFHGKNRAGKLPLCRCSGLCFARVPAHVNLRPNRPYQEAGRPQGQESRSAGIPIDRERVGTRHSSRRPWREAVRHSLDTRRHRRCGPAGEDQHQIAGRCEIEDAPKGKSISALLEEGEIDGFIAPRPPSLPKDTPNVGWLFPDPVAAAKDYFKRTGIFPIMHIVGVRRELRRRIPGCRVRSSRPLSSSKTVALEQLGDTSATKVTLPFVEERLMEARALMGDDFWSYGVAPTARRLETFLRHHHAQGLSPRLVTVEEMFHPGTLETFKL